MVDVKVLGDFASKFEYWAEQSLEKLAAAKKKKLDPKAKVRNRGTVVFPASTTKDKKDHFPINNEGQARNALARSHQYDKAPSWYKGSLKSLQEAVRRKVHSKYPKIEISKSKKKTAAVHSEKCNCENSKCPHGENACPNKAGDKKALYVGKVCDECAKRMPAKYMKSAELADAFEKATESK